MPTLVDIKSRKRECEQHLLAAAAAGSSDLVTGYLSSANLSPDDIKNLVDVSAKSALSHQLERGDVSSFEKLIQVLTKLTASGQCSPITVCNLLSEMFDQLPLAQCQALFSIVEGRAVLWKSDQYFETCKNVLLRACNDLLRRSSKSLNTVFCGRVQLFLARLFPLDEKSALNLMGQFNIENVTHFRTEPWETAASGVKAELQSAEGDNQSSSNNNVKTELMLVDAAGDEADDAGELDVTTPPSVATAGGPKSLVVDFELYSKFWSLQEVFRNPNSLYTKEKWLAFQSTANYIVSIFQTYPLEDEVPTATTTTTSSSSSSLPSLAEPMLVGEGGDAVSNSSNEGVFFSKYLTNEKLLDLQLSDSTFRRCILLQFLISLQYLVTPAKFKGQMSLTADQEKTVREMTEMCYQLLKKTPPKGEQFATSVEKILTSEEAWSRWKNDSCPSFLKPAEVLTAKRLRRRRPLGDEIAASLTSGKSVRLGSAELNRLFSTTTTSSGSVVDNLPVCRAPTAQPDLREFFTEAITQLDGESKVNEESKFIRKSEWQWRALRLLTSAGPQFFTSGGDRPTMPQKKLAMSVPDFLDIQLKGLAPSLGIKLSGGSSAAAAAAAAAAKEAEKDGSGAGTTVDGSVAAGGEETTTMTKDGKGIAASSSSVGGGNVDQQNGALVTSEQMEQDGTLDEAPDAVDGTGTAINGTSSGQHSNNNGGAAASAAGPLVRDHLQSIALLISAHWQSLAKHLAFEDDEIAYFETSDADDKSKQAARMLTIWEERESLDGRQPVLISQLETELRRVAGLESISDRLRQLPNVSSPGAMRL